MLCRYIALFLASGSLISGAALHRGEVRATGLLPRQQRQSNSQTCLDSNLIQKASEKTGQEPGTDGIKAGQSPSATDNANFINFCSGQTLTNGQQLTAGSCNGIPMGRIPAAKNMISAVIVNPQPAQQITADQTFNISVQTAHLDAGFFVNPTTNYYTAPQDLNQNGDIIGHCHVTVQDIGSFTNNNPPDPVKFAFFKGIDDDGNGQGLLQAVVTDGLPVGIYRVCTMIAARNHQPVNMPVAQRGAQDDCTKFQVVAGSNNNGNGGKGSQNAGNAMNGKMDSGKVDGKATDENSAQTSSAGNAAAATTQPSKAQNTGSGSGSGQNGSAKGSLDFGSCTNPAIVFGPGFDGRKEDSFQPADKTQFTHGSALDIDTISAFMCDRFNDRCQASKEAIAACASARGATKGKTGQAAADAWNSALGVNNA
ncbi:hypothetical protein LTR84_006688 [Exophiala bonariae]|uniref:Ribosomal protein s17 n=1 Tax=Exophiala bonariae TaxID=1690606 RepID=A0AAV9N0R7_9EURO|nr:hypothetical protein LTR84_006688 [Exophiala bonariae]